QMRQAAHVVAVTVRQNDEVEALEVHASRLDVLRKNLGIVAGVEEDASASDFDQRRVAPVFFHRRILSKRVIQHCDAISLRIRRSLRLQRGTARRQKTSAGTATSAKKRCLSGNAYILVSSRAVEAKRGIGVAPIDVKRTR